MKNIRNIFTIHLDDEEVGRMDMIDGKMVFTGNADESAKIFFEAMIKRNEGGESTEENTADWWKKCDE